MLGQLVCLGRHTLTGVVATTGGVFSDWSSHYRLYSQERFDTNAVFSVVRREVLQNLGENQPMVVAMDDSILRKRGPKIHGVAWRRDPLGPPFNVNFVRSQRVLQLSGALSCGDCPESRMVPLDFRHVPTPAKPGKKADEAQWTEYRKACNECRISLHGLDRLTSLRRQLDEDGSVETPLWVVVDGRFTNGTLMKNLPERSLLIGRIRGDAKLYYLPPESSMKTGRRRIYGAQAPTPEELRQGEEYAWEKVSAWACGRMHEFRVKVLKPLRWRASSDKVDAQIMVIAPLGYRLRKNSRVLYRKPAYLICTDAGLAPEKMLQAYLWRWDIEVNFRDEKTILGVGQAQVRKQASTEAVPALSVAAYSLLLLAAHKVSPHSSCCLPPPKWHNRKTDRRASLCSLLALLRHELWNDSICSTRFSDFMTKTVPFKKSEKLLPSLRGALFYAPA